MNTVMRAVLIYAVVWCTFRLTGRRTMTQITTFDFVLLLICGDASQQALLGKDYSVTNAAIALVTLVCADDVLTALRSRYTRLERWMEGQPIVVVHGGAVLAEPMRMEQIDEDDVLHAARLRHGLTRMDQVSSAVLETSGDISVIPVGAAQNRRGA